MQKGIEDFNFQFLFDINDVTTENTYQFNSEFTDKVTGL